MFKRPRRYIKLTPKKLPYVVQRKGWTTILTLMVLPLVCALTAGFLYLLFNIDQFHPFFGGPGLNPKGPFQYLPSGLNAVIGLLVLIIMPTLLLFTCILLLDRGFRYRVILNFDGLEVRGLIFRRMIRWDEIVSIEARPNFRLPGYYAAIYVDGSNLPKRHWSNLWFGGYDMAPYMEFGGKDLVTLLRQGKRLGQAQIFS
jgi:Bacterial PH domain